MKMLAMSLILFAFGQTAQAQLESIQGFMPQADGVWIQVASNGCTDKDDFIFNAKLIGQENVVTIEVHRLQADPCLAIRRYGVNLFYSYQELGVAYGQKITFANQSIVIERH